MISEFFQLALGMIGPFLNTFVTAVSATWFFLFPVAFYYIFKSLWGRHIAIAWATKQEGVVLEVFPPRDIEKSPQVMEQFFYQLTATDKGGNILQRQVDGYSNPYFGLEIVGKEGVIHFYVRTPAAFRELVESGLYAQYPGIEIVEVEDYTKTTIPRVVPNSEWMLWGIDFKLLNHDAHPIRTYKSFEEDITGTMIDPLHMLFESMSVLGPGQQMWVQFLVAAKSSSWVSEVGMPEVDKLAGRASKKPATLLGRLGKDLSDVFGGVMVGWLRPVEFSPFEEAPKNEQPLEFRLTPGEKQRLTSLEENLAKAFFNVKMRLIVIGKRDGFTKANVAAGFGGIMKPFNDNIHNSFIPDGESKTDADHLFKDTIIPRKSRRILERYRDRDPSGVTFVMSTEELATIFHMPDMSVKAPGVQFSGSRRGGAPSNLPFSF